MSIMLNRKQKLTLIIGIILLFASFLNPPWGDYGTFYFNPKTDDIIKFVGYSFLFNPPTHYHYQDYKTGI